MFSAFQTFGRLGAGARAVAAAWSPLALWPDGIATPGMWISPRMLTSEWQDYTGTTPVSTPGTVADSSNPVGLALDIRAGDPPTLGTELLTNGDFSDGETGWTEVLAAGSTFTVFGGQATLTRDTGYAIATQNVFTPGKQYQYTLEIVSISGIASLTNNAGFVYATFTTPGVKTVDFTHQIGATAAVFFGVDTDGGSVVFDNVSAKEILGNHMLQSTSAARPLLSARVNLLDYTNDFSHNAITGDLTLSSAVTTGPFGDGDGWKFTEGSSTLGHGTRSNTLYSFPAGQVLKRTGYFKQGSAGRNVQFGLTYGGDSFGGVIDLSSGTLVAGSTGAGTTISSTVTLVNGWYECTVTGTMGASITGAHPYEAMTDLATYNATVGPVYTGDGTSFVYAFGRDLRAASVASSIPPYQSVPGDGSTYASGPPIAQLYDGVDDGMATAAFAAGDLINGMDCMIAVRRDSAAAMILGLYNGILPYPGVIDYTRFFGVAETASSAASFNACGTPTVWVDGVQLTGGTAVTRGTLATALTVGDWHVLELRNLDLSTWTAAGFGLYTSYVFPGARGDILLYPSTASTEDKDAARQYLADKYGVTLA